MRDVICTHCGVSDAVQDTPEVRVLWECTSCEGLNVLIGTESSAFDPANEIFPPVLTGIAEGVTSITDGEKGAGTASLGS